MYPLWNKDRLIYKFGDNKLRIGTDDNDIKEITDNVDIWIDIIKLFNGKNSLEDIISTISHDYDLNYDESLDIIRTFKSWNLIEIYENEYDENSDFNLYFQSAITYYSSLGIGGYKFLTKLQNTKVTVLGVGAGGSHIAYYLAQNGVGKLHLVDPDVVDSTNINRQALFELSDIGKPKVDCLKTHLLSKNPFVHVTTATKRLTTSIDIRKEIIDSDWVICAMDEPPYIAQRITNKACYELNIPSLYCFSQKTSGKLFMVNGKMSACADCLFTKHDSEEFQTLIKSLDNEFNNIITANIKSNITTLCSWIVNKWLDQFSGVDTSNFNKLFILDFKTLEEKVLDKFDKNKNCPTCSGKFSDSPLWKIISIN